MASVVEMITNTAAAIQGCQSIQNCGSGNHVGHGESNAATKTGMSRIRVRVTTFAGVQMRSESSGMGHDLPLQLVEEAARELDTGELPDGKVVYGVDGDMDLAVDLGGLPLRAT